MTEDRRRGTEGGRGGPDANRTSQAARRPKRSVLITSFVIAFLGGILLGHHYWQADLATAALATAALLVARKTRLVLAAAVILGLSLGIWRGYGFKSNYQVLEGRLGQKTTLVGRVSDDPALTERSFVKFSLNQLEYDGRKIPGEIQVTGPYTKLQRGYLVSVTGKFGPTLGRRQGQMFAKPQVLSDRQNWLELWRQRFLAGVRNGLHQPLSDLGLGLLIGSRSLLPKDLQTELTAVGLSHLVAVSGYNLTILVNAAYRPLRQHSKYLATICSLWLILGFLFVSGFSASIIRAAIVSSLMLLARYYGRQPRAMTVLALAAGLTVAAKPDYLWADLGWQLSFLAFFGIMVLAPALQSRFLKKKRLMTGLMLESSAAQLMTFPLIAFIFGQLSLAGPFTNLMILPLVPLAMLSTFVAGLAGMLAPAIAGWFAWPASILLRLILAVVSWFAALEWSSRPLELSLAGVGLIYLLCLVIIVVTRRGVKRQAARPETPPTAVRA